MALTFPPVSRWYACLARGEQRGCQLFAQQITIPTSYVPRDLVFSTFDVYGTWDDTNHEAEVFIGVYDLEYVEVSLGDLLIPAYLVNRSWMSDLYAYLQVVIPNPSPKSCPVAKFIPGEGYG